jgi:hypothetical protein
MIRVRRAALALLLLGGTASNASADDEFLLSARWHEVPAGHALKLSQQITDQLTELGNFIGGHVNVLSDDVLGLRFDGRARRARFRLGTGAGQFLRFKLDTDWHFTAGKARIATRIDLGLGKHEWHLELPDVEMLPSSVYGDRGVEVRLPILEKRW